MMSFLAVPFLSTEVTSPAACTCRLRLLHAIPQHLIGCDEHDADDEGHGERTDEALPHTRLTVLLGRVN